LFAERFKEKLNVDFLFQNIHLLHGLPFEKVVPIFNI